MSAYFNGETVDRLPCITMLGENAAKAFDASMIDYYFSPELMKDVEIAAYREFKGDGINVSVGLQGMSEALGGTISYSDKELYVVKSPAINSIDEIDNLELVNPYEDGRLPVLLKAVGLIKKEVGNEVNVSVGVAGPMSVASAIRGTAPFLKDLIRKPKKAHELIAFAMECNLQFIKAAHENFGTTISIGDPVSSASIIGERYFSEFAGPYLEKYIDSIYYITGSKPTLHICGETKPYWNYISELNIAGFSVDNVEDMEELKDAVGDKIFIIGNVDPVNTIRFGTPQDVLDESKKCIDKALNSPKGFALAPGCQIPLNTPKENIKALVDAARLYGQNAKILNP